MTANRTLISAIVVVTVIAAGCGQTHMELKREAAKTRWAVSRAEMTTRLAEGCYKRGETARARKHIDDVTKTGTPYAPAYILAARLAVEKGDLDDARENARMARSIDPKMAEACYVLGTVEQALGHGAVALEQFAEAVQLKPEEPKYAMACAELRVAADDPEKALADLRLASEKAPGRADVHAALADVLALTGRWSEAAGSYRIALRIEPEDRTTRERLAAALARSGAWAEAQAMLDELIRDEPEFASGWMLQLQATCLMAMGRLDEAREKCSRQAALDPSARAPLVTAAKCDITQDRLTEARGLLEESLKRRPQDTEANALMGYVLVVQGRASEAVPHLRLALKDPLLAGRETVAELLARAEAVNLDGGELILPPLRKHTDASTGTAGRSAGRDSVARRSD